MGPVVLGALVQVAMMWGEVSAQFDQVGFVGVLQDPVRLNGATGIAIAGNYAYVTGTSDDGVSVLNITDPTLAGSIWDSDILNDPRGIAVKGDYAYVGDRNGLVSINVADPTNLVIVDKLVDSTRLFGLHAVVVDGNHAYVASASTDGLVVIDITDPSNLTITGSFVDTTLLSSIRGIDIVGDLAYLCASRRFSMVNISDPRSPSLVGSRSQVSALSNAQRTAVAGNYAYVTSYNNRLVVVNITDLTDPAVIASVGNSTTMPNPVGLEIVGNYVYVSTEHGIVVLDISDPSNPAIVNEGLQITHDKSDEDTFAYGQEVAAAGNHLYMASQGGFYEGGMADISTPSSLSEVAFFGENPNSFLADAVGVKVDGNYAYVVGDKGFLYRDRRQQPEPTKIDKLDR